MRMFFYYFFHSAWNQIRSFIRTWAFLLFIVLFAAGGVIWYGFMWYYHRLAAANSELPADITEFFTVTHLNGLNILELAAGLLILGLLVIQAVLAERSVSGLFKQADVNLLFASDLSPQTVLSFRVTNTLGMGIVAALILAFRLPSIISRFSVTPYAAVSILISWCLLLAFSILLQILIYELGSRHPFFHRNLRWFLFAMLAVIGAAIYRMYSTAEDKELFSIAHRFFNAPGTRWIPIWGWIKGTMMYALEGNVPMSLCMLCLSIALISVLILLVGRLPADYYEETLTAAEEATLLNEEASSEGAALLVMRARKREVSREGFHHGTGSSVYFFRVFHNRIRTSPGYVSKTMLTYSFAALAAGFYVRFFLDNPIEYIHVLLLAVMVFFRTIISPVTEDIRKDTFFLQPEPVWKKLFFSLLGGSCNCAVDVAIPLMIGSMVAGFSPLRGILYLPMLMSVDFFASASGAFTDVSIPPSIGTSVKQVIQVILIYVGLVFDGVFLAYGINSGHSMAGFILVTVLDLLFGGTFLGLTGVWLYPCKGRAVRSDEGDAQGARRVYTRIGLSVTLMFLAIHAAQILLSGRGAGQIVSLYLPVYLIGVPVFLLAMGRGDDGRSEERPLNLRQFLVLIPACCFVMYTGNLLGIMLNGLIRLLFPVQLGLMQDVTIGSFEHLYIQAVLLAFVSPVMEEFVFRRCIMNRLLPYGEKAALISSALIFALFHAAANQVCYAFLLGLVFGYVYIRTGRLRYSMILHVIINTMTSIILPALLILVEGSLSGISPSQVQLVSVITHPGVLALLLYVAGLFVLFLFGAVVFFFGVREREVSPDGVRMKTVFSSWGIILFLVITIIALL